VEGLTQPVVALVASAGGIAAMTAVLGRLPADFPGSVIALQHLSPEQPSILSDLLQRSSVLPVRPARDGDALVGGEVLVAPPGMHSLVTPELRISLVASGSFPPSRPSADLLLTTLALAAGPSAIAVVMTGGGQDGATGATAIHKHGGTVLATDEETSHTFSMPSATIKRDSIHPTVVPLERVADTLLQLVLRPIV
jgi:two-component system, chemotaxis family, protein-glutamate methylesterase/glutaminase